MLVSPAGVPPASFLRKRVTGPFSVTHTMSATSTLRVHPTRSVRRTSGLVLVDHSGTTSFLIPRQGEPLDASNSRLHSEDFTSSKLNCLSSLSYGLPSTS